MLRANSKYQGFAFRGSKQIPQIKYLLLDVNSKFLLSQLHSNSHLLGQGWASAPRPGSLKQMTCSALESFEATI